MRRIGLILAGVLALAGCKRSNMVAQGYSRTWDYSVFFRDGRSMRTAPAGTVATPAEVIDAPAPARIDATMLDHGQTQYGVYCSGCHGAAGAGNGMIVQRGFQRPASLVDGDLRHAPADRLYAAITNGYGSMYSFASRLAPADRWAIVAYIRALQLGQDADPAGLSPEDRTRLAALK